MLTQTRKRRKLLDKLDEQVSALLTHQTMKAEMPANTVQLAAGNNQRQRKPSAAAASKRTVAVMRTT